jgi:hypothetical protein
MRLLIVFYGCILTRLSGRVSGISDPDKIKRRSIVKSGSSKYFSMADLSGQVKNKRRFPEGGFSNDSFFEIL